jgi:hypothetical protein
MDSKREFYITVTPKLNIDLKDVVGKIEFLDSTLGNMLIDRLNKGEDFSIKPFGTGERDEKGNIKTFNLLGFTIRKEEYNYGDDQIDFSR